LHQQEKEGGGAEERQARRQTKGEQEQEVKPLRHPMVQWRCRSQWSGLPPSDLAWSGYKEKTGRKEPVLRVAEGDEAQMKLYELDLRFGALMEFRLKP